MDDELELPDFSHLEMGGGNSMPMEALVADCRIWRRKVNSNLRLEGQRRLLNRRVKEGRSGVSPGWSEINEERGSEDPQEAGPRAKRHKKNNMPRRAIRRRGFS